jgi:hypothetical protein
MKIFSSGRDLRLRRKREEQTVPDMCLDGGEMVQDTGRKLAVCLWLQIGTGRRSNLESECKGKLGWKPLEVGVVMETISTLVLTL